MAFTDPATNIKKLKLSEKSVVVDLGAGPGFYAIAAAAVVQAGHVYAVDIQKELLLKLKSQARSQNLINLDVVWGDGEKIGGTTLADGIADAVVVSNTLFQMKDKSTFVSEAARLLKLEGKILLIDWQDSYGGLGPVPEQVYNEGDAKELLEQAGFKIEEEFDAGGHHYGIVAYKVKETQATA